MSARASCLLICLFPYCRSLYNHTRRVHTLILQVGIGNQREWCRKKCGKRQQRYLETFDYVQHLLLENYDLGETGDEEIAQARGREPVERICTTVEMAMSGSRCEYHVINLSTTFTHIMNHIRILGLRYAVSSENMYVSWPTVGDGDAVGKRNVCEKHSCVFMEIGVCRNK